MCNRIELGPLTHPPVVYLMVRGGPSTPTQHVSSWQYHRIKRLDKPPDVDAPTPGPLSVSGMDAVPPMSVYLLREQLPYPYLGIYETIYASSI